MRLGKLVCHLLILSLWGAGAADAKWWIFGQSENEISTRYVYLNGVSYDELGERVTLYRETLPQGRLVIRGKAGSTSSRIGVIQISKDGKETWEEASRSDDGTFEYSFVPDPGKTYRLYVKIMDTTGKSNDVEATRKEVTVSDQNISETIRKVLDSMIAAYRAEDPRGFMEHVSPDFAADPAILDRAIRQDFSIFDKLDMRYTLNNVAAGSGGKIFVAISFARSVTSAKSGKTLSDKGTTEFIFSLDERGPTVFSMKSPLIFGLSDEENVATGSVPTVGQTIVVGSDGTVSLGAPGSAGSGDVVSDLAVIPDPPQSIKHHQITLTFTTDTTPPYTVAVEEATSPGGPWLRLPESGITLMNPTTVRVMSTNIATQAILLYYRIIIVKDAVESRPSNVTVWDNR